MSLTKRQKTERKLRSTIENLKKQMTDQSAARKGDKQQIKDLKKELKETKAKLPTQPLNPEASSEETA